MPVPWAGVQTAARIGKVTEATVKVLWTLGYFFSLLREQWKNVSKCPYVTQLAGHSFVWSIAKKC